MLRHARAKRSSIDVRRCLSCGYAGPLADIDAAEHAPQPTYGHRHGGDDHVVDPLVCPRCACDFRVRPPRSYAEMEGLTDRAPTRRSRRSDSASHAIDISLRTRWVGFLVATSALLIIAGTLVSMLLQPFTGVGD
jgi:hypothetical protein